MRLVHLLFALAVFIAGMVLSSPGAQERTGTRLDGRAARPAVLHLGRAGEIDKIGNLIQAGDHEAAVAAAQVHVENLRSTHSLDSERASETVLYDALNALCVALMTSGRTDEALDACSEAIARAPRRWAAWNSRGTTYFAGENYEAAYNDFARAFELAPEDSEIVETIEWNIKLARDRVADFQ